MGTADGYRGDCRQNEHCDIRNHADQRDADEPSVGDEDIEKRAAKGHHLQYREHHHGIFKPVQSFKHRDEYGGDRKSGKAQAGKAEGPFGVIHHGLGNRKKIHQRGREKTDCERAGYSNQSVIDERGGNNICRGLWVAVGDILCDELDRRVRNTEFDEPPQAAQPGHE